MLSIRFEGAPFDNQRGMDFFNEENQIHPPDDYKNAHLMNKKQNLTQPPQL